MADESDVFEIDGLSVMGIVANLIHVILAFLSPDEAKALIDEEYAKSINAAADAEENVRFRN